MIINAFIIHCQPSGASEYGNEQLFLSELCDLLDVTHATVEQVAQPFHRALSEVKK